MAHATSFDVADFQQTPSVDRINFDGVKAPPEEARLAYPVVVAAFRHDGFRFPGHLRRHSTARLCQRLKFCAT